MLVVDIQQARDDGGGTARWCSLSKVKKEYMSASATTMVITGAQRTYGQIAPLRAVLEDPKTPVFDEIGHLVPRGVARPEAFFRGQARFLRAERDDILLFPGV